MGSEMERFGDILLLPLKDAYGKLTIKVGKNWTGLADLLALPAAALQTLS